MDADARAALNQYLGLLDLPYDGVYLTGSAALDDWRPGRSDIDIVVVTSSRLGASDLDALASLHAKVAGRPYRDAVYVSRADVGGRAELPSTMDGEFHRSGNFPDPVLWATLDRYGFTVSGPPAASWSAAPDPAWLRESNIDNLRTYWRGRVTESAGRLAQTGTVGFTAVGRRGLGTPRPRTPPLYGDQRRHQCGPGPGDSATSRFPSPSPTGTRSAAW
jgi:hypothetical protein